METIKYNFIAVEGPIGAGKTSLATLLSNYYKKELLLEDPDLNPFLAKFYQDRKRYALATQLNFFLTRIQQMEDLKQRTLFDHGTVSDFLIDKDPIFAKLNLTQDEYFLYSKIHELLRPKTVTPDLVIYLQASPEVLIERVRSRSKKYEKMITKDYLARIFYEYQKFFHVYDSSPLLIVNNENLNFVDNVEHFEMLIERIEAIRSPREFFGRSN